MLGHSNMNSFIRAKYERKEFSKGPVPKPAKVELPTSSLSPSTSSSRSSDRVAAVSLALFPFSFFLSFSLSFSLSFLSSFFPLFVTWAHVSSLNLHSMTRKLARRLRERGKLRKIWTVKRNSELLTARPSSGLPVAPRRLKGPKSVRRARTVKFPRFPRKRMSRASRVLWGICSEDLMGSTTPPHVISLLCQ